MPPDSPGDRPAIPIPKGDIIDAAKLPLPSELSPPRCIPHEVLGDICYRLEDDSWRWIAGEERGQELYGSDVQQRLKRFLDEVAAQDVDRLVAEFTEDPEYPLVDFAANAIAGMIQAHVVAASIPHGGRANMGPREWERIRETAVNYINAPSHKGEGKRYGLRWLFADLKAGKMSPKMLAHRLKGYYSSAMVGFWREVRADAGKQERIYAYRTLGNKKHCRQCVQYFQLGIKPSAEVPLPGTFCDCGPRWCDCTIYYISAFEKAKLEEGVKSGRAYSLGGVPWGGVSG